MSSNCKVHFAGSDNDPVVIATLKANNVKYRLFTAYPFIKTKKDSYKVAQIAENQAQFKHVIVDSGLFTLMFGAKKGQVLTFEDMREWMLRIVSFSNENNIHNSSFVECDCQKLIGCDATWEIREEMHALMQGKEIINVYHLEDGKQGFDKLVEFSNYIAISVPELRIHKPKYYRKMVSVLVGRARAIKPSIKIHLLGCTEKQMLVDNKHVTSADSSSWLSPARYGWFGNKPTNSLTNEYKEYAVRKTLAAASSIGVDIGQIKGQRAKNIATWYLSASKSRISYTQWCGSQE